MKVRVSDRMVVPGWAVSDPRYAALLWLLEPLWCDSRLADHVRCEPDVGVLSIDVYGLVDEPGWSSAERLVVRCAAGLYGAVVGEDSIGLCCEVLDDVWLGRLLVAVQIRRGQVYVPSTPLPAVSDRAEELRARLAVEREVVRTAVGTVG